MSALERRVLACTVLFAGVAIGVAASIGGCGGGVVVSGSAGSSGSDGGAGSSGSGGTDVSGTGGIAGTTSQGGEGGTFVTTTTGSGACTGSVECPFNSYCNDYDDLCHLNGGGTCAPATQCSGFGPVCACDGAIYPTDCDAYKAGSDVALSGCELPPGSFFCGALVCTSGAQACVHYVGFATYDACEDFTAVCDAGQMPGCDCFPKYCECSQDAGGDFVVTCPTGD
jgi:hypothetical protein